MATTSKSTASDIHTLLRDIKTLWDREGFGADESESEPLYARLCQAIKAEQAS